MEPRSRARLLIGWVALVLVCMLWALVLVLWLHDPNS